MGADIENPDSDGCVVTAEPSRNTFGFRALKERLVASFVGNPDGTGGGGEGDGTDTAAKIKTPNGAVAGGGGTVDVAADEKKPAQLPLQRYVLYSCSAIFLIVSIASVYPMARAYDDGHTRLAVLWGIGVFGGFSVAKLCAEIARLSLRRPPTAPVDV